jgi:hypothetical protein
MQYPFLRAREPSFGCGRFTEYRPRLSDQRERRETVAKPPEARMHLLHYIDERLATLAGPIQKGGRLPLWLSILVIVVLSALCWAVLITTVLTLRGVLMG